MLSYFRNRADDIRRKRVILQANHLIARGVEPEVVRYAAAKAVEDGSRSELSMLRDMFVACTDLDDARLDHLVDKVRDELRLRSAFGMHIADFAVDPDDIIGGARQNPTTAPRP